MPANTLALVSPWLAAIGLVCCIGAAVVFAKKRRAKTAAGCDPRPTRTVKV